MLLFSALLFGDTVRLPIVTTFTFCVHLLRSLFTAHVYLRSSFGWIIVVRYDEGGCYLHFTPTTYLPVTVTTGLHTLHTPRLLLPPERSTTPLLRIPTFTVVVVVPTPHTCTFGICSSLPATYTLVCSSFTALIHSLIGRCLRFGWLDRVYDCCYVCDLVAVTIWSIYAYRFTHHCRLPTHTLLYHAHYHLATPPRCLILITIRSAYRLHTHRYVDFQLPAFYRTSARVHTLIYTFTYGFTTRLHAIFTFTPPRLRSD